MIVNGQSWVPGETVHLTAESTPIDLGTVTANPDGTLPPVSFAIPTDFEPGLHTVTATGSISGIQQSTFTVLGGPTTDSNGNPIEVYTGGSVVPSPVIWLVTLLACLAGGILIARQPHRR